MKRRDFMKSTATLTGGGLLAGMGKAAPNKGDSKKVLGPQPNILFILVDELRYPSVFPEHIKTPGEFLAKYMPNVHSLWKRGVKFGKHHSAANACTPSRGVMITGLYSHQSWLMNTILSTPYPEVTSTPQPVLNPAFPTFGKLLRNAGYQTPYIGKWHVSVPSAQSDALDKYGFDFKSYYDPTGENFQGTYGDESRGYHSDAYCASQAVDWLANQRPADQPWCLTVSLINPHDREFYPAGTEYKTVTDLFTSTDTNPAGLVQMQAGYGTEAGTGPVVAWEENALKDPPSYGYPTLPPNYETRDQLKNKPSTQVFIHDFSEGVWGGATNDPSQNNATVERYPSPRPELNFGIARMPFSYWQRGLDSYTQVMEIVDVQIGRVLNQLHELPRNVIENTVIVFVSDHGEYSGAHGLLQGKMGSVYEEAYHIPLIVVDPSGRFTGDLPKIRTGLTSSIDFSTLLVSIGNGGTRDWMTGNLARIYGERHDMISMLKSADAPGRPYILHATDEVVPDYFNFNAAATHVLGLRTDEYKLGVYSKWIPLTSQIIAPSIELEFYDYSTAGGQLELTSTPDDPRVQGLLSEMLDNIIPNELQAALPGTLRIEQEISKIAHLVFREVIQLQPAGVWTGGRGLQALLGFGLEF